MKFPVWVLAFALLPATLMLSGCVADCPEGPPVTARQIGAGVASAGGEGDFTLRVHVTEEPGGPALAGAGVVVYWGGATAGEWSGDATVVAENGPDGQRVRVDANPGRLTGTPEPEHVLRLRTGADGVATARVPADRIVGVVAAADGWTEEWTRALATGAADGHGALELPLYRARLNVTLEGAWGPGGASPGAFTDNDYLWHPLAFPFGDDPESRAGYLARLDTLQVRLEWENGIDGYGDLALALGPTRDDITHFEDSRRQATPGVHDESLEMDASRLRDVGLLASPDAYLGPASETGYVAPFDLPYRLEVDAHFDTAAAARVACAGGATAESSRSVPLGLAAPLLGLGAAALVAAARGREPGA